jgi:hypothetical protein
MSRRQGAASATASEDETAELGAAPPLVVEESVPPRQCGRCRLTFPGDPTLDPFGRNWWLCPPCHEALLGRGRGRS